ncbi:hypothetical protein HDU84_007967 [Entophlyctis sp. JEL0112]|nr:hypothetical protein HDU84_007967 [Entophlyctis sp. JEL0112]
MLAANVSAAYGPDTVLGVVYDPRKDPAAVIDAASRVLTTLVLLPHPRTGEGVFFGLSQESLLQVTRHPAENTLRSCFVGDNVLQDGSYLAMTPFDPLFLLLPLLDDASAGDSTNRGRVDSGSGVPADAPRRFTQLEHILHSETFPMLSKLSSLIDLDSQLRLICEVDEKIAGLTFYRISPEKVTEWLLRKADRILSKYDDYVFLNTSEQWEASLTQEEKQRKLFYSFV